MRDSEKAQKISAGFVLVQGLATAAFPQLAVTFVKRMLGGNFDNVSQLEAKSAYLRQLRAVGVGMVAAAGTDLLLQSVRAEKDGSDQSASDEAASDEAGTEPGTDTE